MSEQRVTFHLNKLVRDKLPAKMEELGQEPEVRQQVDVHTGNNWGEV